MNLLNPWAMGLGAAAVALPIVVHLLTRPRPVRVPLSTVRFVLEAVHQRRARYRLRDLLILAMRMLAVALLAWAFARPLLGVKPLIASSTPGAAGRVIILDQSQSMAAVSNGVSAFDRGKPVAAKFLAYQPGLKASVMLAAAKPRATFAGLSENLGAMRDEIASAKPRAERLDVQAAINAVAEVLAKTPEGARREVVIVSDFQRSNWVTADFSPLPQDTLIQLESVAPKQTPANLAIVRIAAKGRIERGREALLEVDIANHWPTVREVAVEVTLGSATHRLAGFCPPGVTTTLSSPIVFKEAGWQIGQAKITGGDDALAADDARPLVVHVRPMPAYALLTREPAAPRPTSSHYLERALVPIKPETKEAERVVRIDPLHLDRAALSPASMIVIDHPGKLSAEQIELLAGLLRRGRGILYVAAEANDATNLKALASAAAADLKMPVEFMPAAIDQPRKDLFLAEVKKDEPPFAAFGEQLPQVIGAMRFSGGLASRRLESGLIDDVFATYSDRSACLVVTQCGAGTLAVLNADLPRSSLPASPVFVPLVGELVTRLLSHRGGPNECASGEAMTAFLPAEAGTLAGLALTSENSGTLAEEGGFVLWRCAEAGPPGVYAVKRGNEIVFALASTTDAVESDLATIDPALFGTRLAGGRTVQFQVAADGQDQKDDAWAWILVGCCVCIMGELALLKAFRT